MVWTALVASSSTPVAPSSMPIKPKILPWLPVRKPRRYKNKWLNNWKPSYKDLLFQLEQIENRNHIRIPSIRPNNNKSYPYTAEFGVRLISSNRTSTYYIPVGNDDAIIVGVRFIDTGDDYRKTLEHRVKTHSRRLEELIEKVNSAENKKEAQKYIKEIKNILSQGEKHKETDEELTTMFTVPKVEITPPKHI